MFNPFKAVGDFFSGLFGGNKKNDDEERRRREAAAKAQQPQQQQQQVKQSQSTPQKKQGLILNQEQKSSFQLGQQPTSLGQPKNKPKFGLQLNSDFNDNPAQPQMADLSGGKNDNTVADTRPFPMRVPNDHFQKANEQLKKQQQIKDVGGYYNEDAVKLKRELMKGDRANKKTIEGLTQSLVNREGELNAYNAAQPKQVLTVPGMQTNNPVLDKNKVQMFVAGRKEQEKKKKEKDEVNKFLTDNGDKQLPSGYSINSWVDEYNNSGAYEQKRMWRDVQNTFRNEKGDTDESKKKLTEAYVLSKALEEKTKTKEDFGANVDDWIKHTAPQGGEDIVKGIIGTGQRGVGTLAQAATGLWGAADTGIALARSDKKAAKEKNDLYVGAIRDIGRQKAVDDGSMSFISENTLSGKANPLQFGAEFTKAGVDMSAFVMPELKALSFPKAMAVDGAVNFGTGTLADAADQYAKTGKVDMNQALQSGTSNAVIGGVMQGVQRGVSSYKGKTKNNLLEDIGARGKNEALDGIDNEASKLLDNADNIKRNKDLGLDTSPENTNLFHYDGTKPKDIVIKLPKIDELRIADTYINATPDAKVKALGDTVKELEAQYGRTNDPVQIKSIHDEFTKVNAELEKIDIEKQQLEANPSQEPIATQEAKIAEQQAEIAKAAEAKAQAEATQTAENAIQKNDAEIEANNAYKGGLDKNAMMERLQSRRSSYQADPAAATKAAEDAAIVNREAGYDPTAPADKAAIAKQLTDLGVDQNSLMTIVNDGGSINRLNQILNNTDWSKVDNPTGYIRNAVRRMAEGDKSNPTMAAYIDQPKRNPMLNEAGEVMTDADGRILYQPEAITKNSLIETKLGKNVSEAIAEMDTLTNPVERASRADEIAQGVVEQLDTELKQTGSDVSTFMEKLALVRRGEADASILTPAELEVNRKLQTELGDAIGYAEQSAGTQFGRQGGDFYAPETRTDMVKTDGATGLLDRFNTGELAGSTYSNTRAIPTNELDFSSTPIRNYVGEMLLYGRKEVDAIYNTFAQKHPDVSPENIARATDMQVQMTNELNAKTRGSIERIANLSGDVTSELDAAIANASGVVGKSTEIGKELGQPQEIITNRAKGLTDQQKLENIRTADGRTLFDKLGFAAYQDADTFAASHIKASGKDLGVLREQVTEYLKRHTNMTPEEAQLFADATMLKMNRINVPEDVQANILATQYRKAAKNQMVDELRTVDIQDKGLARLVDKHASEMLVSDNLRQSVATNVNRVLKNVMNQAVRTGNVSSAINEMSDLAKTKFVYGYRSQSVMLPFGESTQLMQKYGLDRVSTRTDANLWNEQEVIDIINQATDARGRIDNNKALKAAETIFFKREGKSFADTLATGQVTPMLQFWTQVEKMKGAAFLKSAEEHYSAAGFTGDALTRKVIDDYRQIMLPVDRFQRTVFDKMGAFGQYGSWAVRNMQLMGRIYTGNLKGNLVDKGVKDAITHMLPSQATIWLGSNLLKGTSLLGAAGLTDYLGVTNFNNDNISDKNWSDEAVRFLGGNAGIIGGLMADTYLAGREDNLYGDESKKTQYYDYQKSVDKLTGKGDITKSSLFRTFVPGGTQTSKSTQAVGELQQGYTTNKDGRIKYQTTNNPFEMAQAAIFGNSTTSQGRTYGGNENFVQNMQNGQNPLEAVFNQAKTDSTTDAIASNIFGQGTRDYNRPLSGTTYAKGYSDIAKEAYTNAEAQYGKNSPEARQVLADWIKSGQEYNRLYDKFGKDNPEQFKRWTDTYDADTLTPEKWRVFEGNPEIFNFIKSRRQMEKRDLGRAIDPIYEDTIMATLRSADGTERPYEMKVTPEMVSAMMQERGMYTGDDMRQREMLYKSKDENGVSWYKVMKAAEQAYYNTFEDGADTHGREQSERVKQWQALSKQAFDPEEGVKGKYNLLIEADKVNDQYGFGSAESKAWFKSINYNEYQAQKNAYESERFTIVNEMRKLEGIEPLTVEQYMAKIEFPEEDEGGSWSGGKFGNSKGGYSKKSGKGGYSKKSSKGGGSYSNDWKKINYVTTGANVTAAPTTKGAKLTKNKLKVSTSAGSKTGRKITIGARSTYRG